MNRAVSERIGSVAGDETLVFENLEVSAKSDAAEGEDGFRRENA